MTNEQKFVLEKNLGRFDHYINAINTKAAFLVSFNTFILGTLLLKYEIILSFFVQPCLFAIATILICICLVSIAFVIAQSFFAVSPFLKTGVGEEEPDTLFFFLSVANMKKIDYIRRLSELEMKDIYIDLANQTHVLAKGASEKFKKIKLAIVATMFGTIFPLFLIAALRVIDWMIS